MNCNEIQAMAAVYRELSPEEKATVDRHTVSCGRCARALAAYMAQDYRLRALPAVSPSPALGTAVMARTIDRRRPAPRLVWQLATAAASLALVLGLAGAVAIAQEALPGQTLYPLKRGTEQVQLWLSPTEKRQALVQEFASRRLGEVQQILQSGAAAQVEFQGTLQSGTETAWLVQGLPVIIPATSWPGEPPDAGSALLISAFASGGELTASSVSLVDPAATAEPGANATARPSVTAGGFGPGASHTPAGYGPGAQPTATAGGFGPGPEPSFTPGAYGPGAQPTGTPGGYGPGAEPSRTPGAFGPGAQPTGTPGGNGPGQQPTGTPGGYGPGEQPTGTPEGYGPGGQPTGTPEGYGPGGQPTGTPEGYGPGGQPTGTPEGYGPGGQPTGTPGAYGPGEPQPTHSATAVGPGPLPDHTPTGVPPEPWPSVTPAGVGPGPLPDHTPTAPGPGPQPR